MPGLVPGMHVLAAWHGRQNGSPSKRLAIDEGKPA